MESNPEKVCVVCSTKARENSIFYNHYGAICCYSCKAFFRRFTRGEISYSDCKNLDNCDLNKGRKNCKTCRYKKCLNIGMVPQRVLNEEDRKKYSHPKKNKRRHPDNLENLENPDDTRDPDNSRSTEITRNPASTDNPDEQLRPYNSENFENPDYPVCPEIVENWLSSNISVNPLILPTLAPLNLMNRANPDLATQPNPMIPDILNIPVNPLHMVNPVNTVNFVNLVNPMNPINRNDVTNPDLPIRLNTINPENPMIPVNLKSVNPGIEIISHHPENPEYRKNPVIRTLSNDPDTSENQENPKNPEISDMSQLRTQALQLTKKVEIRHCALHEEAWIESSMYLLFDEVIAKNPTDWDFVECYIAFNAGIPHLRHKFLFESTNMTRHRLKMFLEKRFGINVNIPEQNSAIATIIGGAKVDNFKTLGESIKFVSGIKHFGDEEERLMSKPNKPFIYNPG